MAIVAYDPIIAVLRTYLLANDTLTSLLGTFTDSNSNTCYAVYPGYLNTIVNPVFPCITITMDTSETVPDRTVFDSNTYYVHGWSKNGPDELAYLYNLVVSTLDADETTKSSIAELAKCRKVDGKFNYDIETRTDYFMTQFSIIASRGLMNA